MTTYKHEVPTGLDKPSACHILQGILPLDRSRIPNDIVAGITLAALAIPEDMAYTKIAGTPVITGLYTMLIPMAVFALFGSSRHLVVGADSATATIMASGLVGLAATGSAQYVALCGLLAIMAAAILILARLIRLGFLADFLSRTVLIGFLTGVGVQVACDEIGGMLGLPGSGHGTLDKLVYDARHLRQINLYTLGTAATVLIVILGSKKFSRKIPGPFIAVIGAITASWAVNLKGYGVAILGPIPSGIPPFWSTACGAEHETPFEALAHCLLHLCRHTDAERGHLAILCRPLQREL